MSALHQQDSPNHPSARVCPGGTRLLIGLSGGSDFVALTLLLKELAEQESFSIVSLAHLNHRLRCTATRDEQFCRDFAERLGIPIAVESIDVGSYAHSQRLSVEDAARRLRYDFFHRASEPVSADRIAVGHTRDDQAETFLLKLIRGAGLTGLGGIYPRRDSVIRPLIEVGRADLRRYLESRGQGWVEDETNEDLENPRPNPSQGPAGTGTSLAPSSATPAIARAAAIAEKMVSGSMSSATGGSMSWLPGVTRGSKSRVVLAALRLVALNR